MTLRSTFSGSVSLSANGGLQLPAGKPRTRAVNMNLAAASPLERRGPAAAEARR
jgi:hypothetical protein